MTTQDAPFVTARILLLATQLTHKNPPPSTSPKHAGKEEGGGCRYAPTLRACSKDRRGFCLGFLLQFRWVQ